MTPARARLLLRRPCALAARITLIAVWIAGGAHTAQAADAADSPNPPAAPQAVPTKQPVRLITLDLAVPDSPALTMLGVSPATVVRPASPRDLVTTALNGVDRRGNLQSGLAVDFAPLFLFAGKTLTYEQYRDSAATRLYGRTQVSAATAKGSSEADKSLRVALGLRATVWDAGDPRLDRTLVECLDNIPTPPPTTALLTQAARDAYVAKATAERRPAVEACQRAAAVRRWNASSFAIGVAPSWQSPTGESGDFVYAGAAWWTALALALSRTEQVKTPAGAEDVVRPFGQLIVQGRYRDKELIPDKIARGTFFEQDSAAVAARLVLGTPDTAAVIESELVRQSPSVGDSKTSFKLSGGGQLKLGSDLWLSLSAGAQRGGPANEQRSVFVLSSFKWALSREPAVQIP